MEAKKRRSRGPNPPLTDEQRCTSTSRGSGERCLKAKLPGTTVCQTHAYNRKTIIEKAEGARVENYARARLSRMERLVGLIDPDDPEARGDVALITDIRRTVNRIRILDEWIQELGEGELGWGATSEDNEKSKGFDKDGPTSNKRKATTYEAKINVYYSIQLEERKHLLQLSKVWLGAGFKQRELDLQEQQIMAVNSCVLALVTGLGHNPADPAVRATVHRALLGLQPKGELTQ